MEIIICATTIQCILIIALHTISAFLILKILFHRFYQRLPSFLESSPSITLYFVMQVVTSSITILYAIQILRDTFKIAQNIYVWVSIFNLQKIFFIFLPLTVFGVGLDRCLAILYPMGYPRKMIPVAISGILMALFLIFTFSFILPSMYPTCSLYSCATFASSYIYVYIRYGTSVLILATTILLMVLFRRKFHVHLAKNVTGKANKVILITLLITFAFDFVPHIFISLFYTITGLNIAQYIGPGSTTIGSVEALLCAILYSSIFKANAIASSNHHINPIKITTIVAAY